MKKKNGFSYWLTDDPCGPWGFLKEIHDLYIQSINKMQSSFVYLLLTPSNRDHPERKKDEPFLPSSRGELFLRFTLVGATTQDPFWNVLVNNLSSKNPEQDYSKHRDGSSIPGSLLEMLVLESHPWFFGKWHLGVDPRLSRAFMCSPALVLWSEFWDPTFPPNAQVILNLWLQRLQIAYQTWNLPIQIQQGSNGR